MPAGKARMSRWREPESEREFIEREEWHERRRERREKKQQERLEEEIQNDVSGN